MLIADAAAGKRFYSAHFDGGQLAITEVRIPITGLRVGVYPTPLTRWRSGYAASVSPVPLRRAGRSRRSGILLPTY